MQKTVVINVVGLTKRLIGEHTPFLASFLAKGKVATITPVIPAVTCTAQSTYLTGKFPDQHGIVGNGWYFKDECEIKFWRQSNKLVQSEKIWEKLKKEVPNFTCANMFWWYNMYAGTDYNVTPRPNYLADGRKLPDCYAHPAELRDVLQAELGTFPLFHFWGPKTSIKSSQWIADATLKTDALYDPTLTLVYLPHLDYNLQRYGLDFSRISKDLGEVDAVVAKLVGYYEKQNANIILLSEYGITNVDNPVHLNRVLRKEGLLQIRIERGLEVLDAGASKAFAVSDHQLAHVYLNDKALLTQVKQLLKGVKGVQDVFTGNEIKALKLDHERAGDLVVLADASSWFTYYYWNDDQKAPDFARMVDIHKKPGYDPVEMLLDPKDKLVYLKILVKLIKKKLGFRTVLDVIPLQAELVKGSHGRNPEDFEDYPIFATNNLKTALSANIVPTAVFNLIEYHVKG